MSASKSIFITPASLNKDQEKEEFVYVVEVGSVFVSLTLTAIKGDVETIFIMI